MISSFRKSWGLLVGAVLALALAAPAYAVAQSEPAAVTVADLANATDIGPGSSSSRPDRTEVASNLPAGPTMGSPAALPAPALVAPVRNEQKLSGERRPELPKKTFFTLALLNHSAVTFDAYSTRRLVNAGGSELNPVLKPISDSNALYAVMQIWPTAMDYMGARMARSSKPWVRKMWWVPQTATAASSFVIGARNISLANSSTK